MPGRVVTFYSYKGGVGRSFALANIAVVLAEWGYKVLVVDWDIEAPGLNHYFAPYLPAKLPSGVLGFLSDCESGRGRGWRDYAVEVDHPVFSGRMHLMTAAAGEGGEYSRSLQALNWDALYRKHGFGARLEALRGEWVDEFDLVLVDSRTGITDFSGVTTAQLPDVLAFMFTANRQSLNGCADVARRAMEARRRLPVDRPALLPLPIPARFEQREEYDRAKEWRRRFEKELKPFCDVWAPSSVDAMKLIDLLTIPYVPRWTFGEDLACLEERPVSGTRTPSQAASYSCETIAALLAQGFAKIDLLTTSRDEYVHSARSAPLNRQARSAVGFRVFVSVADGIGEADRLVSMLRYALTDRSGGEVQVFFDRQDLRAGADWSSEISRQIETADAYVVALDSNSSKSRHQQQEVEHVLRTALRSDQRRTLLPIVMPDGESSFYGSRLADYKAVFLDSGEKADMQIESIADDLLLRLQAQRLTPA